MKLIAKICTPLMMTALLSGCAAFESADINVADLDPSLIAAEKFRDEALTDRRPAVDAGSQAAEVTDVADAVTTTSETREIPLVAEREEAVSTTPTKPRPEDPPPKIDAQCGTAAKDGVKFIDLLDLPKLCAAGTPKGGTQVTNRWLWSCVGSGGGRSVNCGADISLRCFDRKRVSTVVVNAAGVHNDIAKLYTDFFGQAWQSKYHAGAKYLTGLYLAGYTLDSLRRDLANDKTSVNAQIDELYLTYLGRRAETEALTNVRNFLLGGGNLRQIEIMLFQSAECQEQNK